MGRSFHHLGRRVRRIRRGSIKTGVLILCAGSTLAGGAMVAFRPTGLSAAPPEDSVVDPERALVLEGLATMLRGTRSVLGVRERGSSPFTEIVLWTHDTGRPGHLEASELLVVAHSRTLRSIFVFDLDPEADPAAAAEILSPSEVVGASFLRHWRDRPDVRRRVVATDIMDLSLVLREGPDSAPVRSWRLDLTWPSGSADDPETGGVLIDLPTRGSTAPE